MRTVRAVVGAMALAGAGLAFGQAPPPGYGAPISLDNAKKVIAAAVAEARKNSWNVAIAVVDSGGHLVAFERLDGTQFQSALVAQEKAHSSVAFRRPTKAFADAVTNRVAILGLTGAVPLEGGQLIVMDGKIVGGIGVSGVTSQQDDQIATAGLAALK